MNVNFTPKNEIDFDLPGRMAIIFYLDGKGEQGPLWKKGEQFFTLLDKSTQERILLQNQDIDDLIGFCDFFKSLLEQVKDMKESASDDKIYSYPIKR